MRFIPLFAATVLAASSLQAQDTPRWRFGLTVGAPARLLEVNSNEVPDSNNSHVDLGLAFGLEVTRLKWVSPKGAVGVYARASLASANVTIGGGDFSPGKSIIAEVGARVRRQIRTSVGVIAGAGVSHWTGPEDVSPFEGLGAVLVTGEAGVAVRVAQHLSVDLLSNLTRVGANDQREQNSGFVWRILLGVHREQ